MPQVTSFIKHLAKAKNRHGVHSPFVYALVDEVVYAKNSQENAAIEKLRNQLLRSNELIEIKDYGAGSRVMKTNRRTVREIVRHSASNKKTSSFLKRLVSYFQYKNILELGTNLGISSLYLAENLNAQVHTIEGCPNLAAKANENFAKLNRSNIISHIGTFEKQLTPVLVEMQQVDMAFLDGNHKKEATLNYFKEIKQFCHNDSLIIIGDIHWSKGMEEAWEEIKKLPEVNVTIDMFSIGLVFFRKEQVKQDFLIRF